MTHPKPPASTHPKIGTATMTTKTKTPIEVALHVAEDIHTLPAGLTVTPAQGFGIIGLMAAAIEADRAERNVDHHEIAQYIREADGASVVLIDTASGPSGRLRIILNDGVIWDADPEDHEHERCSCIGAELEGARERCTNCDEDLESDDVHAGGGMCGSCNHNARRSG